MDMQIEWELHVHRLCVFEKGRRAENQSNRRTSDSGSVLFQSWHSPSSNLGTFPTSQAPVEMLTLHMMTTCIRLDSDQFLQLNFLPKIRC